MVLGGFVCFLSPPPISDGSWWVWLFLECFFPFLMSLGGFDCFLGFSPQFQWVCMLHLLFPLLYLHFGPGPFVFCAFPTWFLCFLCISDLVPLFSVHFQSTLFVSSAFPMGIARLIASLPPPFSRKGLNAFPMSLAVIFFRVGVISFLRLEQINCISMHSYGKWCFDLQPF